MSAVEELRIGVVGAGAVSYAHMPHLLRLGREVRVYAQAGAEDLVGRFGGKVVDTLDDLLAEVDVVDVLTPTSSHADVVGRALEADCDVICEKPLTRHTAEAERLVQLASDLGRQLQVAHVVRYFPEYEHLHDAVADGVIGTVAVQRFTRSGPFPTRGTWFTDRANSGGIVFDQMIHDIDIARWLAGDVVRVSAAATTNSAGPVEAAHVLLTHESGVISHVAGTWGPAHIRFGTTFYVGGTAGVLRHDSLAERDMVPDLPHTGPAHRGMPLANGGVDPYGLELEEFLTAIAGGAPPRVTAADALEDVRVADAALRSLERGESIGLDDEAQEAS